MIYRTTAQEEQADEEAEYLDEDGSMCFQPINWDTLFRTTFGEVVDPVPEGGSPIMEIPIRVPPHTRMPMQVVPTMETQAEKAEPVERNPPEGSSSMARRDIASAKTIRPQATKPSHTSTKKPSGQVESLRRSARLKSSADESESDGARSAK